MDRLRACFLAHLIFTYTTHPHCQSLEGQTRAMLKKAPKPKKAQVSKLASNVLSRLMELTVSMCA
jgi:hypothetical protein